jgi:hypothetical protein
MATTKSNRPRQIEEESDAAAPNLPIGSDHEDDTINQGSGDAGVTPHVIKSLINFISLLIKP